eukprot:tig00000350_g24351.t1
MRSERRQPARPCWGRSPALCPATAFCFPVASIRASLPRSIRIPLAITVTCGDAATDLEHSIRVAERAGIPEHIVLRVPHPRELIEDAELLSFTVRACGSFDPMEIRNAIVTAHAMREAKRRGFASVATGDAADELFAGYSFLHAMPAPDLRAWTARLVGHMRFSALFFGRELGLRVCQPFLDPAVVDFALTCSKEELVGPSEEEGARGAGGGAAPATLGKLLLRRAFPEASSRWRRKDPCEVGAGTTGLPQYFEAAVDAADLEAERARILREDRVRIRDAEHLVYYRAFRREFRDLAAGPVARFGDDPCRSCGFQLERPEQRFCVVCGEWPAREEGPPAGPAEPEPPLSHEAAISLLLRWFDLRRPQDVWREMASGQIGRLWEALWFCKGEQRAVDAEMRAFAERLGLARAADSPEGIEAACGAALAGPDELLAASLVAFDQVPAAERLPGHAARVRLRRGGAAARARPRRAAAARADPEGGGGAEGGAPGRGGAGLPTHLLVFYIMAFVHSEEAGDQRHAEEVIHAELSRRRNVDENIRKTVAQIARNHRERVEAFGCIPERDVFLGRPTSDAARAFLAAVRQIALP